jgi:hypothetical protein
LRTSRNNEGWLLPAPLPLKVGLFLTSRSILQSSADTGEETTSKDCNSNREGSEKNTEASNLKKRTKHGLLNLTPAKPSGEKDKFLVNRTSRNDV